MNFACVIAAAVLAGCGGSSNSGAAANPPAISSVSPSSAMAGCGTVAITINGSAFDSGSVVSWNGSPLTANLVSSSQMMAIVPGSLISQSGSAAITVANASGVQSAPSGFSVTPHVGTASDSDAVASGNDMGHSGTATIACSIKLPSSALWSANFSYQGGRTIPGMTELGTPMSVLTANGKVYLLEAFPSHPSMPGFTEFTQLYALDAATGSLQWGPVDTTSALGISYDGGLLFLSNSHQAFSPAASISALNAQTGATAWQTTLPTVGIGTDFDYPDIPVVAGGIVYVPDFTDARQSYALLGLDERTGTLSRQALSSTVIGPAAADSTGVYLNAMNTISAFSLANAGTAWSMPTNSPQTVTWTAPLLSAGAVYAPMPIAPLGAPGNPSSPGFLVLTKATGSTLASGTGQPVAVSSQSLFVIQSGKLQALNPTSLTSQWQFAGDGTLQGNAVIVGNTVFIGSASGTVFGLDATTGNQVWSYRPSIQGAQATQIIGLSVGGGMLLVMSDVGLSALKIE